MLEKKEMEGCRLFVTLGREYAIRDQTCLRVRERASGRWAPVQPNRVLGTVPREETDPEFAADPVLGPPRVGERLCIQVGGRRVVTDPILAVEDG